MASALDSYVGTHYVGSTGGVQLIRRIAASHHGSTDVLDRLVREIDYDRKKLSEIMKKLDISPSRTAVLGAWLGGPGLRSAADGPGVRPLAVDRTHRTRSDVAGRHR